MNTILRTLALAVAALSLAALGGCAHYEPIMTDIPGTQMPTAQQIKTQLKGHAFEVGTVKVDLNQYADAGSRLPPPADKQYHPLPDWAYAKLLKWELDKAFTNAKLGDGTQPTYTVNVTIQRMSFTTNAGLDGKGSYIYSLSTVVSRDGGFKVSIPYYTASSPAPQAVNEVCNEMRMRQQIPGQAAGIAYIMSLMKEGKNPPDHMNSWAPKMGVPFMFIGSLKDYAPHIGDGLYDINILTPKQARDITGLPLSDCHYKGWDEQNLAK